MIALKDNEIYQLKKNNESITCQNRQLISDRLIYDQSKDKFVRTNIEFPRVEAIQTENLRDYYNNLWLQFKEICREKDQIYDSFKTETLQNEQQRIHIELLKQTIETSINKLGMNQLFEKHKINFPRNFSNADIIVELMKNRVENENNKNEIISLNKNICKLKKEIESITFLNHEYKSKYEKLNIKFEKDIKNLNQTKEFIKSLENDKEKILLDLDNVKSDYEKMINQYNLLITDYDKIKNENSEISLNKTKIEGLLQKETSLEFKLSEQMTIYDKLKEEFKIVLNDKSKTELENKLNIEELKKKNNEFDILNQKNEEYKRIKNEETQKLNNEIENLNKKIEKLELEIKNLELISKKTNKIQEENIQNIDKNYDDFSKSNLRTDDQKISETFENNDKVFYLIREENLNKIKKSVEGNENSSKSKQELDNDVMKNYSKMLSKELQILKENYKNEINLKEEEILKLYSDLNNYKRDKELYRNKLNEYTNELEFLQNENTKLQKEYQYKFKLIQDENNQKNYHLIKTNQECYQDLEFYTNLSQERKEVINNLTNEINHKNKTINETINNYKINLDTNKKESEELNKSIERLGRELEKTLLVNEDLDSRLAEYIRNNEDLINQIEVLEIENYRIEKNRRILFEENESLKRIDKNLSRKKQIDSNSHDIEAALHSCLKLAKNFSLKILNNSEYNDFYGTIFKELLTEYSYLVSLSDSQTTSVDNIKSFEDWIFVICSELESSFNDKKQLFKSSEKKIEEMMSNLKTDFLKLQEENKKLYAENHFLNKKLDDKSYINVLSNNDIFHNETTKYTDYELDNLIKELTYLKEINQKLLNDYLAKNCSNLLENIIFKLADIIPSTLITKIIQEILVCNNQFNEIEKEKYVLSKKLNILEQDCDRNDKKLKDQLNEGTVNFCSIRFEIDNLRKLMIEYENHLSEKKDNMKKLQNDLQIILNKTKECKEVDSNNKQFHREFKENTIKSLENGYSSKIFKSNYIEKQKDQQLSNRSNEGRKFERLNRVLRNDIKKTNEQNDLKNNDKLIEFRENDISFSSDLTNQRNSNQKKRTILIEKELDY